MRRMREGGSWHVRVSLARTGHWIERLGRVDGMAHPDLKPETIGDLIQVTETPFGRIAHVAPAARLPETPPYWSRQSVPLGPHPAEWPADRKRPSLNTSHVCASRMPSSARRKKKDTIKPPENR